MSIQSAIRYQGGDVVGTNVLCVWRGETVGKPRQPLVCFEGDARDKSRLEEAKFSLAELASAEHNFKGILISGGQTMDVIEKEMTKDQLRALKLPIALATPKPDPEWDDVNLKRLPLFAVLVHARDGTKEQFIHDPELFVRKHWGLSSKESQRMGSSKGPERTASPCGVVVAPKVLSVWRGEAVDKPDEKLVSYESDARDTSKLPVAKVGILEICRVNGKQNHEYQGILIHGGKTLDVIEKLFSEDCLATLNLPFALATPKEDPTYDPINLERLPAGSVIVHHADGTKADFLKDPKRYAREVGGWQDLDEEDVPRKARRVK